MRTLLIDEVHETILSTDSDPNVSEASWNQFQVDCDEVLELMEIAETDEDLIDIANSYPQIFSQEFLAALA